MKKLSVIANELREQIEEATDPKNPARLKNYCRDFREGVNSLLTRLTKDPTMAAIMFYDQIRFDDASLMVKITKHDRISSADWPAIKQSIQVLETAHGTVKVLEDAGLQNVLVAAVAANYLLKTHNRALAEESELEKELQNV